MASSEKDIDKILQDIKKRREGSGVKTPVAPTGDVVVQQKPSVLIKELKTVELKRPQEEKGAPKVASVQAAAPYPFAKAPII
ncbi:MAG: hypothetical protein RR273_02415, partial [Oscillospiraceae bacterium]